MKDKLALIFGLLLQLGAVVWWASQLNASFNSLRMEVGRNSAKLDRIEQDVNAINIKVANLQGKLSVKPNSKFVED